MKILINFGPLKSGGGQNVALNFILGIDECKYNRNDIYYLVAAGSCPHEYLKKSGCRNFHVVPRNPILRIVYELIFLSWVLRRWNVDVIYSYFGFGLFLSSIPQVCGAADSNLFYPEIDFWEHYNGISRLKRRLVDLYRLYGLKHASAVVFENKDMQMRAVSLYNLKVTEFIMPSVSFEYHSRPFHLSAPKSSVKILFLCGWQKNKNYMVIPELASEIKRLGRNIHFIITAPLDGSAEHLNFLSVLHRLDVQDMVSIVGTVEKAQLPSLYSQIDFVALLSNLESFSNNIIESWYFKKPLILASEPWAKAICEDAAIYVARNSVSEIVSTLISKLDRPNELLTVIAKGQDMLKKYPTIESRIEAEIRFLERLAR